MTTPSTPGSAEILIVEDSRDNLNLLMRILAENGYKVRPALSGRMAITAAEVSPPDLILLDIMLTDMDGFAVCRELKAQPNTKDIPIIFVSAKGATEDKVKAFSIGGVDYITKPYQIPEILARIHTHITIRNLQRELQHKNNQLQEQNAQLHAALNNVKTLSGLLPICANCKKIRDDAGYWHQVESYIRTHTDATFSHGICPDCMVDLYPDYEETSASDS
jgi:DNA-binding response OmpR family regulator